MISVIYEKEDKKIAIKISQSLESKGFSCNLESISNFTETSENKIHDVELAVLVFSQKSNHSEKMMSEYDVIFDNDIPLVPFVVTDVELSLTMQHFLNSHDWINAFDSNTNEAIGDLGILVNEIINGEDAPPPQAKKQPIQKKTQTSAPNNKNQTYLIIGVVAVLVVVLGFFIFGGDNGSPLNNSESNHIIVGNWRMADYQDNMPRQPSEYADFITNVTALKQNFLLALNPDNSFKKLGFSQAETGTWQYDEQNKLLYMWPPGSEQHKDILTVEKLTQDSLIMSIASQIDSANQIITRFKLYKE